VVGCHPGHNARNVAEGVQYSCNPYFYAVTRRIIQQKVKKGLYADAEYGLNKWFDYMQSFGLGKSLEADVSGQRPGVIPNAAYYDKWYGHHRWAFSTIRSISIGQGEVKLTPLQMANYCTILANRGWYYPPHVIKGIDGGEIDSVYRTKKYTTIERQYFDPVVEGMRNVVLNGTGRIAQLDSLTICGKTGTAQNPHGKDHSIFICFAPMVNPKIAIAVYAENAGFGGQVAAPVASLMIEKYLKGEIRSPARKEMEKMVLKKDYIIREAVMTKSKTRRP
jgi:penicillin-binding protein 2